MCSPEKMCLAMKEGISEIVKNDILLYKLNKPTTIKLVK